MNRSYLIAGALAVASVLWIGSGLFGGKEPAPVTGASKDSAVAEKSLPKVRVRLSVAEPRAQELVFLGRTEASRKVVLRAETPGRIASVPAPQGAAIKRGAVIANIAMDVRQENLAEAKAILRQRKIEFDVARELSARNFRSKVKLAEAEAVLQSATSAVARIELDIRRVRIDAPFDGVLDRRAVEIGDVVPVGGAVATIVDLTPIYIVGHVSELDVNKVQKGATAKALLVNGSTVRGKVRFVASEADEATRTYRVEIVADNTDRRIIAGMTAEIRIELAPVSAHKISPAVLTLADAGMVGVKTVGADGVVAFYAINIVDEDASGAWITGLAKRVTLITIGQEFVKSGEKVDPVPEPGPVLTNAKGDAS